MYNFKKSEVKEAVDASNGTMVSVAKNLGVRSSNTANKILQKYPDIVKEFEEIQAGLCDRAMNTISDALSSKNEFARLKAAEFILKYMPQSPFKQTEGEDVQSQLIKLLDKMVTSAEN